MNNLYFECILIGTITSILGNLILELLIKYNDNFNTNENLKFTLKTYKNDMIVQVSLFLTGIFLHLLLEYIGLNNWYCEKVCYKDKCKLVCVKN